MTPFRLSWIDDTIRTLDCETLLEAFERGRELRAHGAREVEIIDTSAKPGHVELYEVDTRGRLAALQLRPLSKQAALGLHGRITGTQIARPNPLLKAAFAVCEAERYVDVRRRRGGKFDAGDRFVEALNDLRVAVAAASDVHPCGCSRSKPLPERCPHVEES